MRIGIDIGGTTVKIGFVNNNKIIEKYNIETKCDTLFSDIFESIIKKLKKYNIDINEIEQIGFGIPGSVSNNYINRMPNLNLDNIDLNKICEKYTNSIIKSSNDANCAALGETIAYNIKSAYFITLGTGVGGGYIYDGKVIEGYHNACGEIGHIHIDDIYNFKCTCGLVGCLETIASATGVVRLANYYKDKYQSNIDFNNLSAKEIFNKAKENDPLGIKVLDVFSEALGKALAILAITNDPESFIIGGGVSEAGDIIIENIKKYYDKYSFYACKNTKIFIAKMKNDAGILGASNL